MSTAIDLGDLRVEVIHKAVRNLHLAVLPPQGKVRVTAPMHMKLETIRVFTVSRLAWIKTQQRRMRAQEREAPRQYLERESHHVWGRRYLLKRQEVDAPPAVVLKRSHLVMQVRPGATEGRCQELLDAWYREQLHAAAAALVATWEPVMGVRVRRVFVQRMKTRWGSCNPAAGTIRLNTDLAKKPPECLEYLVVHEMAHLLAPTHNARFLALMNLFLPNWQQVRAALNRLPVKHEDWDY
jgi:predicted metal-dependent hydrolase